MDETDIETLLEFVLYMAEKAQKDNEKAEAEQAQYVTLGGKTYRKVTAFTTPI